MAARCGVAPLNTPAMNICDASIWAATYPLPIVAFNVSWTEESSGVQRRSEREMASAHAAGGAAVQSVQVEQKLQVPHDEQSQTVPPQLHNGTPAGHCGSVAVLFHATPRASSTAIISLPRTRTLREEPAVKDT